jgi:chorismate dehydratase
MPTTLDPTNSVLMNPQSLDCDDRPTKLTRVGAVAYLNTKPLIYGLEDRLKGFGSLQLELPSRLAAQMEQGELDVGLIPVVEYLRNRSCYRLISDAGIACQGPVWSVRVLFRVPPEEVKTLGTDEGSRTSVALSQVLLANRLGKLPELVPFPIGSMPKDCPADAVLVIGDRAMNPDRYRCDFYLDWDLGEQWYALTGLPFVFAMWVARSPTFDDPQMIQSLEASRDEGLVHVDEIIAKYAAGYGLSDQACREYLTQFLRFRIGDNELRGLGQFANRCEALGLL